MREDMKKIRIYVFKMCNYYSEYGHMLNKPTKLYILNNIKKYSTLYNSMLAKLENNAVSTLMRLPLLQ